MSRRVVLASCDARAFTGAGSQVVTLPGPRGLVLGDMGEVGDRSQAFHAEVGAYARTAGIERFWAVGQDCIHAAQAFLENHAIKD